MLKTVVMKLESSFLYVHHCENGTKPSQQTAFVCERVSVVRHLSMVQTVSQQHALSHLFLYGTTSLSGVFSDE